MAGLKGQGKLYVNRMWSSMFHNSPEVGVAGLRLVHIEIPAKRL